MNKEYKIKNDEVLVKDENNKETTRKNNSKIDEILISENKIEFLENEIRNFVVEKRHESNYLKEVQKNVRNNNLWNIIFTGVSIFIALLLGTSLAEYLFIFSLAFAVRIVATMSEYIELKNLKKRIRGLNNGKISLDNKLLKERERLEQLNNEKEYVRNTGMVVKRVNDSEEIKELRNLATLYYDCGYHEDEYTRYYKNNTLEGKLMRAFSSEEIEIIKEYFENKMVVDSKKKVRKR